jgi:hypothetical protein
MAPQPQKDSIPDQIKQIETGLVATLVALSMLVVLVSGFAMSVGFLYLNPDIFRKVVTDHFRGIMGPPVCAMTATAVVAILHATSGTIKFEALGTKCEGASGPIVLWVLTFLALTAAGVALW